MPTREKSGQVVRVTDKLETPSLDDRAYRVIRLPNQLEALLVHDAETDKASASLDVNVGNFSDEEETTFLTSLVSVTMTVRPRPRTRRLFTAR